ncbi:MAG: hypothetical protein JWM25_506 [Thermoleophilia bacterium]|nr:hypothetical protein [Thermoleophilia bacterium]MCZ4495923.1 hypothetical protein [Thermoleophilia bacterium]
MTASISSPAVNPLSALTGRVKPLDVEELSVVAQEIAARQQTLAAHTQAVVAEQTALREQAAAPVTTTTTTPATAEPAPVTAAPVAVAPVTTTATQATTTPTQATTGGVSIPASSVAPRTQYDYWNKHIAQFAGKYLPDGPSMRPNCGPASVTMALRMVGLDIPGFSGQNSEAVLDKARILATGKNDTSVGTTDSELETLINKSGAQWSESTDFNQVTNWIKQGIPVVLSGNPAQGWNSRYTADQVYPFDGGHWVTVSGYDAATGHYIVNDPLSQIGPIYVSEAELRGYNQAHGNLGIAVFRDQAQANAA